MSALFSVEASQRPDLRWYQAEAVEAVHTAHVEHDRVMVVAATGTGKSVLFAETARKHTDGYKRVLCLAHRKELVEQNANTLQWVTGQQCDIERAEYWASNRALVVSASLATICQPERLARWPRDHFDLIIGDEFHHFRAPTYQRVWDHFTGKKLGVTATADRADKKALGKLVEHVAYKFDILQGIESGYLVPIEAQCIEVKEIDISAVKSSAGELQSGMLDDAMLKAVEGIISKTLELYPDRQGVWFWPGVKCAELAADRLNALKPGSCGFVHANTEDEERDETVKAFRKKRLQHLSNCSIFVEGADFPTADMVVMGAPTLSRGAYAQRAGRGLRVLPGVVDHIPGKERAAERRAAIAASLKPNAVLLDFVGNSGKHSLVSPTDLLGDSFSEAEVKAAKKRVKERSGDGPSDILEELRAAQAELKASLSKIQSQVKATVTKFDPFTCLHMKPTEGPKEPVLPSQLDRLRSEFRLKDSELVGLDRASAAKLMTNLRTRRNLGLASLPQLKVLQKHGVTQVNISFRQASKVIDYIASAGWKPDPAVLQGMVRK